MLEVRNRVPSTSCGKSAASSRPPTRGTAQAGRLPYGLLFYYPDKEVGVSVTLKLNFSIHPIVWSRAGGLYIFFDQVSPNSVPP